MISAIVCIDKNWGIGFNGELLEHIPEDMKHFKELTTKNTVVMGRKTWDSLPKKPLPDRCNIIISRQGKHYEKNDGYYPTWTMPLEECIMSMMNDNINDYFIIGGGQIYEQLLPYCDRVYITKIDKNADRIKRHQRVRKKVSGTAECPRLSVYRSLNHIYAQIIDDVNGNTLCASSSLALANTLEGKTKVEAAKAVGQDIATKATQLGVSEVVFDRGGYIYTGRVAALADGAREAGLKF